MTAQSTTLKELPSDLDKNLLPRHVAVIMDGNGRWAKRQGLPRIMGHRKGADSLKDLLRCCKDWGIPALTAYAFSTENWGRPLEEVGFLMALIERVLRRELREMMKENVKISFVGDLSGLPQSLQEEIEHSMEETKDNRSVHFTVATNYGGRQEILQACRTIASQVKQGLIDPQDIDETMFAKHLCTANVGDPDLLIRTSGEMRLSNFLLWQMAYAELYITDKFWPEFDRQEFHRALTAYQKRDRRFGKVSDSSPGQEHSR